MPLKVGGTSEEPLEVVTPPEENSTEESPEVSSLRRSSRRIPESTQPAPICRPPDRGKRPTRKSREGTDDPSTACSSMSFSEVSSRFKDRFVKNLSLDFLDSGSINLNKILGGGFVRGKIYDLHSPSGLGKSTLTQHFLKTICRNGMRGLLCDSEFAVTDSQIDGFGLRPYKDSGLFSIEQVATFSEIEEVMDSYIYCNEPPDVLVVDSATDLKTSKMDSGEQKIEDVEPGWQSRLLSNFFLKYKSVVARRGFVLIMINQMRTKISFSGPSLQKGGGGNPMEFFPDVRLQMGKEGEIKEGNDMIGTDVWIQAIKNKIAPPFVKTTLSILFGKGVSNIRASTFMLQQEKAVTQSGSSFYLNFGGFSEGVRGRAGLEGFIREHESEVLEFLKSRGRI